MIQNGRPCLLWSKESRGRQDTTHQSRTMATPQVNPNPVAEIVKQVLVEMEPFIERTIMVAVDIAIEAILLQLEKNVLAENERLTKVFDIDMVAQHCRRENVQLYGGGAQDKRENL